jgi:taurine dioxygenase
MGVSVSPLSSALGAEIKGANIAAGIEERDFQAILDAWHAHSLICLSGQDMTEDDQIAFGRRFGTVGAWSRFADDSKAGSADPYLMYITNHKENGEYIGSLAEGEIHFHSDGIYIEKPVAATMLYALEVTTTGGETLFANMYTAYETLPADIKDRIEGLEALHAFTYNSGQISQNETRKTDPASVARCTHPVIRTHPVTGRKALYVNRLMTHEIVGLPAGESDDLLTFLFDHMEQPDFVYEHVWHRGDVLLWDNRCLAHARRDFPANEPRLLKRLTIEGEKPR